MTTITVYALPDGAIKGFTAAGHAGGRKLRGYDLVCCAVSALTQTGVNALCSVAKLKPQTQVADGYLRCILPDGLDSETNARAQIVLETVLQGLSDVSTIYPKLLRIQHEEWRPSHAYDESSALRA